MSAKDILVFVEDPGAANFVLTLPGALSNADFLPHLIADGHAREYLRERCVDFQQPNDQTAAQLISAIKPALVIVGTSENVDTLGLELVLTARAAGIPTMGVVDAEVNAQYRFAGRQQSPLFYAPDRLLVPDQNTRQAYVELGFDDNCIVVCGHPYFDEVERIRQKLVLTDRAVLRQTLFPSLFTDQKVIAFIAEVSDGLNPAQYQRSSDYSLTGRGSSTLRTDIVIEEFLDAAATMEKKPYLVLRLHPKNTPAEFAKYSLEFDLISSGGSPHDLIFGSDLVVGMSSFLLTEAALLRRSVLSVVPRQLECSWLSATKSGWIRSVSTRDDLKRALAAQIEQTPLDAPSEMVVYGATANVVREIERLLLPSALPP